jgi:hypothetical protein
MEHVREALKKLNVFALMRSNYHRQRKKGGKLAMAEWRRAAVYLPAALTPGRSTSCVLAMAACRD